MATECPRVSPRVLARRAQGQTILYDRDRGRVHVLDEAGSLVWRLCDGRHDVGAIASALAGEASGREVPDRRAEADVRAFLAELDGLGLLSATPAPVAAAAAPGRTANGEGAAP